MLVRTKGSIMKAATIASGVALLAAIFALTSARAQSRFTEARYGEAFLFIDKYIPSDLRDAFIDGIGDATDGFLVEAGLLGAKPARGPVAYFAGDRHYGVVSPNDALVRRRLKGRPSSDFSLFGSIGANFYANELVTKSVSAQDGSYVFVNVDERWRPSVLHAHAHAIAAANAPASVAPSSRLDQGFDAETRFAFRFADEVFALLASDLYGLAEARGGVDAAWSSFPAESARRYTEPGSDVLERQAEIVAATYDLPQKSAEFYAACNSFAAWLLESHGRDALCAAARLFYSGGYASLDEPFAVAGGLVPAIRAWKGDGAVPR